MELNSAPNSPPPPYGEVNPAFEDPCGNGDVHTTTVTRRVPRRQSDVDINGQTVCTEDTSTRGDDSSESKIDIEEDRSVYRLLYKASETPPIQLLFFFGFQQALLSISASLSQVIIAAEVICAEHDEEIKSQLLSSTLFVNGIATILMVTVGSRLPLYQGSYSGYLIPLLTIQNLESSRCELGTPSNSTMANFTSGNFFDGNQTDGFLGTGNTSVLANSSSVVQESEEMVSKRRENVLHFIRDMQGSLIVAGCLHAMIGCTGLLGVLLRFIGPVTIVPTILLLGIYIAQPVVKLASAFMPIAIVTVAFAFILAFYLAKFRMPIPIWTPSKGFRVILYPLHKVYAILISILVSWFLSYILTICGVFPDKPDHRMYEARTDVRLQKALSSSEWIFLPYPGLYGAPSFSTTIFAGYLIATFISILDSIGDYYACARMSHMPTPPRHAMNRGIFVEGMCTVVSGAVGAPVGTTTYGPNIGAIGITKVASRSVFVVCGVIYIVLGLLGKLSAVFISIPKPVLGGSIIMMGGMFIGVNLSNLKPVDLSSSRNLAIIGVSVMIGLVIPQYVKDFKEDITTGYYDLDMVLKGLLGNPNFSGSIVAFLLDNTVPGTLKERGITAWLDPSSCSEEESQLLEDTEEIYEIPLPKRVKRWRGWKYIPFMPYTKPEDLQIHAETNNTRL